MSERSSLEALVQTITSPVAAAPQVTIGMATFMGFTADQWLVGLSIALAATQLLAWSYRFKCWLCKRLGCKSREDDK